MKYNKDVFESKLFIYVVVLDESFLILESEEFIDLILYLKHDAHLFVGDTASKEGFSRDSVVQSKWHGALKHGTLINVQSIMYPV